MTPSDALATRKGAAKRSQGHVQAGLLSRVISRSGVPTLSVQRKATPLTALCVEPLADPVWLKNLEHARNLQCARTGRPHVRPTS